MTGDLIEERVDDQPESTLGGGVRGHVRVRAWAGRSTLPRRKRVIANHGASTPPDPKSQYWFADLSMNSDCESRPVCVDKPRQAQPGNLIFLVTRVLSKKSHRPTVDHLR